MTEVNNHNQYLIFLIKVGSFILEKIFHCFNKLLLKTFFSTEPYFWGLLDYNQFKIFKIQTARLVLIVEKGYVYLKNCHKL